MRSRLTLLAGLMIGWSALAADAQTIADVRVLYAGAAYADALDVLDSLGESASAGPALREGLQYRALCLLALGRRAEAEQSVARIVTGDPLYTPDPVEAPPQLRELFKVVRERQLPALVRQKFAAAKEDFTRDRSPAVAAEFDAVLALLDTAEVQSVLGAERVADMRTLATGFRDLATAPPSAPAASASLEARAAKPGIATVPKIDAAPAPAAADADVIFELESPGVTPPGTVRQEFPPLRLQWNVRGTTRGRLQVVIDRQGRVESAAIVRPFHPLYDAILLQEARTWRYTPATRNGIPVRFRKVIEVVVAPAK